MQTTQAAAQTDGLSAQQRQAIQDVLAAYPQVTQAVLYGSRAMGRQRPGSDIDLTLLGELDLFTLNEISNALDDLLLPFAIDLSAWNHIENISLKEHIQRVGKTFWERAR